MLARSIVAAPRAAHQLAPGVWLNSLLPGGKEGPHGEVLRELPGGQTLADIVMLGTETDGFQVTLPDIRLPPNQYWPLHWHDCWIGVVVLEGSCLIGDWWMEPGDLVVTAAGLEYGPLLIGPKGCRMFEIFAKHHLQVGGYAPEYRDHPTLQGTGSQFIPRSGINKRNEGRQCLPLDGVEGIMKGHLSGGGQWDLGPAQDPERAIMKDTPLAPGERTATHKYDDWHITVVLHGEVEIAGHRLVRDDYLLAAPDSAVGEITAGATGAQLFELSRSASGMTPRPV